ncbi:hypothetical protein TWF281_011007 [Arthrobotrys megalospora]
MVYEQQIRTEILAIPQANTTTALYDYGIFQQPNSLPPEIEGIMLSSPLRDYSPVEKQYQLCWSGIEYPAPNWKEPSICDARRQNARSQRGLVWIPQNRWEGIADNLITLDAYDQNGNLYYRYITAAILNDRTIMLDFQKLGEGGEGVAFEFKDISTKRNPGIKTMALSKLQWGIRTGLEDWQREVFYVCDHPEFGRSVFIANPYTRTTNKELWHNIPCQICSLQARYRFEIKRERKVRPLAERIGNLSERDKEDPENIRNYRYETKRKNIPRVITFVDEDGIVERPWTPNELLQRHQSEAQGIEYIRPYILERRARDMTMDTMTNLDLGVANAQRVRYTRNERDAAFNELLGTIEDLDNTGEQHMRQVPLDSSDEDSDEDSDQDSEQSGERAVQQAESALDRTLETVLRTGNRIALLALLGTDTALNFADIDANAVRALGSRFGRGGMERLNQLRQQGQIRRQEIQEEDEESGNDEMEENINPDISPSDSDPGERSLGSAGSNANSGVPLQRPNADGGYCGRFFGRVCNGLSAGVSRLLGWSQGPSAEYIAPGQADFREPVELDVRGI